MIVYLNIDIPEPPNVANDKVPEPLVCRTWFAEPSLVGKVIASLIVRDAGFEPISTIAADPSFFSVYILP